MPKLRVTCFNCTDALLQKAQWCSTEVDGDNDELPGGPDFDDCFGARAIECGARDNTLGFTGFGVALTFGDLPGEDDVFKIEDAEVVIVKLFGGVG